MTVEPTNNLLLRRGAGIGLALAVTALFGDALVSFFNVRSLTNLSQRIDQSHNARAGLFSLLAKINEAEASQRRYFLTSAPEDLEPFEAAQRRLPDELAEFRALAGGAAASETRLRTLEDLAVAMMTELTDLIQVFRVNGYEAARDRLRLGRARELMTAIFAAVQDVDLALRAELDAREVEKDQLRNVALVTTTIGTVFSLCMVGVAFVLTWRELAIRRDAERAARDSESRFRLLTEAVPQFVWTTRPDGRVDYLNRRWYDYTGLKPADSLGSELFLPVHPEDLRQTQVNWHESLRTGRPFEEEYRLRGRDGEYRWFLVRAQPQCDAAGRIVRWLGTGTDIDDQRRHADLLEAKVRKRTSQLESSNRELEQFASIASHDLQEPLRKIQAFGDRLEGKCGDVLDSQGKDYLARILTATTRMRNLISDLLAFARVTTNAQPPAFVDLAVVLAEVENDLEGRLHDTKGTITVGSMPRIEADPTQMRQVFQNLLGNALKFHRPGVPPEVHVEGRMFHANDQPGISGNRPYCLISVRDNGIGFDEGHLERIFQMFQRLHGRTEYEGTGIGLAICRKIVERHGGHLTARSTPGVGSTFMVMLPLRQSQEVEVDRERANLAKPRLPSVDSCGEGMKTANGQAEDSRPSRG